MRVAINGFGRIGRLVTRRLADNPNVDVAVINDLAPSDQLTYLFKYDSVHGRVDRPTRLEGDVLHFGDSTIDMLTERDPGVIDWGKRGIDVVIDATGVFRTREMAQKHFDAGAKKVIITAPSADADRTVVMGVNEHELDLGTDHLISNASCTTNCLAPVAKVLNDEFGIINLSFTTVHAYTSSQNLVDVPIRKMRRGRAAAVSMIPTTTGASKALALVLPELEGKTAGMALRVPVPDGSVTDITVRLENPPADAAGLNSALARAAAAERMAPVLEVTCDPIVSIDIVDNSHSSIVDALATMKASEDTFKLLAWYDNEWGYACRVADLANLIATR